MREERKEEEEEEEGERRKGEGTVVVVKTARAGVSTRGWTRMLTVQTVLETQAVQALLMRPTQSSVFSRSTLMNPWPRCIYVYTF